MKLPYILRPHKVSKMFSVIFATLILFSTTSPLLAIKSQVQAEGETALSTPVNLGWNIQGIGYSATPTETPLDLNCSSGVVYTDINSVAQNWTAVEGSENLKYQRKVTYPNGNVGYFYSSQNYIPFSTFGGNPGIQGLWGTEVRAYEDTNNNNVLDTGEIYSDWSNSCSIVYDSVDPVITSLQYQLNSTSIPYSPTTPIIINDLADLTFDISFADNLAGLDRTSFVIWDADNNWNVISGSHKCNWNGTGSQRYLDNSTNQSLSNQSLVVSCTSGIRLKPGKYLVSHIVYDNTYGIPGNHSYQSGGSQRIIIEALPPVVDAGPDRATGSSIILNGTAASDYGLATVAWTQVSGPGSVTFNSPDTEDTEVVANLDGVYTLRLTATDQYGNSSYDEMVLTWDENAPLLAEITRIGTYLSPDGDWYTGDNTPDYTFSSNEAGTLATQGACSTATTTVNAGNNTITFNALPNGLIDDCLLVVTDTIGNYATLPVSPFTVDKVIPVIVWNYPVNNSHIKGIIDLSVNASDNLSGIQFVRFGYRQASSSDWTTLYQDTTEPYTTSFNTNSLTEGQYVLRARIMDNVGNFKTYDINITVDNTLPSLEFLNNVEQGPVQDDSVSILAADTNLDLTSLKYALTEELCDANIAYTESYTNSEAIFLNTEDNGKFVCAKATDKAGNTAYIQSAYPINIDQQKPEIDTISNQTFNEGEVINFGILNDKSVSDDQGLDKIYLIYSYTDLNGNSESDSTDFDVSGAGGDGLGGSLNELFDYWFEETIDFSDIEVPLDTSLIPEGVYSFDYYATDLAGNRSDCDLEKADDQDCHFTVTVNNVAPTVNLNQSQTIQEGQEADFSGSFSDPSFIPNITENEILSLIYEELELEYAPDDAEWTIDVDYGDGSYAQGTAIQSSEIIIPSHVYSEAGIYTVTLTVCEATSQSLSVTAVEGITSTGEGECRSDSVIVTVENSTPTAIITTNPGDTSTAKAITMTATLAGLNNPVTVLGWIDGNFPGCSGNANSVTTPSTPGTYYCRVTVQDADGDTFTTSRKSVTVNAQPVNNNTGGTADDNETQGQIQGASTDNKDENNQIDEPNNVSDPQVLGESTCENESKITGYIYVDENDNSNRDKDEKGLKDITVKVYSKGENRNLISKTETDENGYWETKACPGDYEVEVEKGDISSSYKIDEKEVKGVSVEEGTDTNDVNFRITEEGNTNLLLICGLPLLLALLGSAAYVLLQRRDNKLKLEN